MRPALKLDVLKTGPSAAYRVGLTADKGVVWAAYFPVQYAGLADQLPAWSGELPMTEITL